MDTASGGNVRCLTDGHNYHEHASFSPDGQHIVWMTNQDNPSHGTDWWIMQADGSHKRRLTNFNLPGYPESGHWATFACLTHWAPNGMQLLGGIQYSLIKQEGRIFLISLDRSLLSD
jgi:Tol biopolymer transport system component